jgi:hypothetical protein
VTRIADLVVLLEAERRKRCWFCWAWIFMIAAWATAYAKPAGSLDGFSAALAVSGFLLGVLAEFVVGEGRP